MIRETHRCYTLLKGDLEEVVTEFPHFFSLLEDKVATRCRLLLYPGEQ